MSCRPRLFFFLTVTYRTHVYLYAQKIVQEKSSNAFIPLHDQPVFYAAFFLFSFFVYFCQGYPQGLRVGVPVLRHAEPLDAREAAKVPADVPATGGREPEGEARRGSREDHHQDRGTVAVVAYPILHVTAPTFREAR